jgi:hypothetical protein
MRRHTYTADKGYAEAYKGREVTWDVPETVEEAIRSGEFEDEATLVRYATAQLNIKKGHAIQRATVAKDKDGNLANPNMTLADMEKIAADTKAKKDERQKGGKAKVEKENAKKFDTAAQKAKAIAENASPEKLATLLELGFITQEEHDSRLAAIAPAGKKGR